MAALFRHRERYYAPQVGTAFDTTGGGPFGAGATGCAPATLTMMVVSPQAADHRRRGIV
jgi:hypothetical protein